MEDVKLAIFETICATLNEAKVRYLVAGGLAVNAHGYLRLTYDVDLVIQLGRKNILAAFGALAKVGYKPTVPVTAFQFADIKQRNDWIKNKRMQVLNFHNAKHQLMPVDVFVNEPFDFSREYKSAIRGKLTPDLPVRFVSISTLIKMKKLANRPKDLDDIEHLRELMKEKRREK